MTRGSGHRTYRAEGIVLRGRDFGEADRILTLFTPEHGKVRAVAKGVRRANSKKSGHVEPFCRCAMLLSQGRDLDLIEQAETLDAFPEMRSSLERLGAAFYLAELVDTFTEEGGESRALYQALVSTFVALEHGADVDISCRWFEVYLLTINGSAPSWSACVGCGAAITPDTAYVYSVDRGGLLCPECAHLDAAARAVNPAAVKLLRLLAREPLSRLVRLRVPREALDDTHDVLALAIRAGLEYDLRSPLVLQRLGLQGHGG